MLIFMRLLLLTTVLILNFTGCKNQREYIHNEGFIFGTVYNIKYESKNGDLHKEIKKLLFEVNKSLSPFDTSSIISRFNNGEDKVFADSFFVDVFNKSVEISNLTDGAFDITIAHLINLWGFGFEKYDTITHEIIDSLMQFTGMEKVYISDGIIKRKKDGIMLNASAIAKGYGVDVVANFLKQSGLKNFMVEIGGEISASGVNQKKNPWRIGIENPLKTDIVEPNNHKSTKNLENKEFKIIVKLSEKSMATSGNYNNFREINGKNYGHTIDPRTGYPVQPSFLSATIIASDCMTADAFATVCMVIGLEKSMELLEKTDNVEGLFIFEKEDTSEIDVAFTSGFENYIYFSSVTAKGQQ